MTDSPTLRNKHGQLTPDALKSGLTEQVAKLSINMVKRTLTLAYDPIPEPGADRPWIVTYSIEAPGKDKPFVTRSRHRELRDARATFHQKEKHL